MGYVILDANGNVVSSGGSGPNITYNRLEIGVLLLNQQYSGAGIYDFRVPGDSNNNTFKYRFTRDGVVLGVSMTGTVSTTVTGAAYVQRYNAVANTTNDVMIPSDAGNQQTFDPATFAQRGAIIMAPTPVPYKANDMAAMKFWAGSSVTVSLSGFLIVGLVPQ